MPGQENTVSVKDGATEKTAELVSHHRHDGNQRVPERVLVDHDRSASPLERAVRTNSSPSDLEHARARLPRDHARAEEPQAQRGQHEVVRPPSRPRAATRGAPRRGG